MSVVELSDSVSVMPHSNYKLPADIARTMSLLQTILRIFEEITTASLLNRIYAQLEQVVPISTLGQFTVPRLRLGASKAWPRGRYVHNLLELGITPTFDRAVYIKLLKK